MGETALKWCQSCSIILKVGPGAIYKQILRCDVVKSSAMWLEEEGELEGINFTNTTGILHV